MRGMWRTGRTLGILAVAVLFLVSPSISTASASSTDPPQLAGVIDVAPGGDLQAAIDQAQPGDTIRLAAGTTYTGSFVLPAKTGAGTIVIRTSAPDTALPPEGTRMNPA